MCEGLMFQCASSSESNSPDTDRQTVKNPPLHQGAALIGGPELGGG